MQKLELTWIGKGQEPAVEPRILLHTPDRDYGDPAAENMLIHGDNLLALKALEQEFAGQVKCIYIEIIMQRLIQFNDCRDFLPLAG